MTNYPVLQPNGLFAIWSTIVESPTFLNCTVEDIVSELATRPGNAELLRGWCQQLKEGHLPREHWSKWDEALACTMYHHGAGSEIAMQMLAITPDTTETYRLLATWYEEEE